MSNPTTNIRRAFEVRLAALPSLPSVAWPNRAFPPVGTSMPDKYLQPFMLPGEPFQAEIGTAGANRHSGVYQISVFTAAGIGMDAMDALVGALCDHFKRGTLLPFGGVTVSIIKAYPSATQQETDWQHVPITIRYKVLAAN